MEPGIGSVLYWSVITDIEKVMAAVEEADQLFRNLRDCQSKGIVIQRREDRPQVAGQQPGGAEEEGEPLMTNVEFHPMLFRQHATCPYKEFPTLSKAVDEFFSARTSQKQDIKALNVQKTAVKKLENVKRDHMKRIDELQKKQEQDRYKAQLIEYNIDLVERASTVIRSAVANAMDWGDVELLVRDAQARGDPVALAIHSLKLASNEVTLLLREPTGEVEEEEGEVEVGEVKSKKKKQLKGTKIDIDLGMSAFSNARRYYEHKKSAFKKEQKTIAASEKALKSAEKKTKQTLKDASTIAKIKKARKIHWFEKFYWFISSENFLVIGGRDQQQNEQVVKRYLTEGDLYVHADLRGAPSVIIKNTGGGPVPPRTLTEAGSMAVCYSSAWEARIVTSAWWVHSHQVSKTAPSGEYLTTGSFMIRGRKNFLPPCDLTMGFGFLFKVDEMCIHLHLHERQIATDDQPSLESESVSGLSQQVSEEEEVLEVEEDTADQEEEEEEEVDSVLPDTTITLSHIGGDTFELKRWVSETSTVSLESERERVQRELEETAAEEGRRHQHISAKQRRDMKRQDSQPTDRGEAPAPHPNPPPTQSKKKKQQMQTQQPPVQVKRGQKAKQKKMRDKYGDQDEEERELRMKILASGQPSKQQPQQQSQQKGGRKGQKNRNAPTNPKHKYHQKSRGKDQLSAISDVPRRKQLDPQFVSTTSVPAEGTDVVGEGGENLGPLVVVGEPDIVVEDVETVDGAAAGVEEEEEEEEEEGEDGQEESEDGKEGGAEVGGKEEKEESASEGTEKSKGKEEEKIVPVDLSSADVATAATNGATATTDDSLEREYEGNGEDSDEEEKKAILADENIHQLDDTEKDQLSILDSFTGSPVPEDIMIYAIPVCAPYTAVTSYKYAGPSLHLVVYAYRVKLVPGTNKRGKAARAALHRFIQSRDSSQREKDLLKSVKDNDLSRYIPGKVKISIPQSQGQRRTHK
ncbi:Nuclear export mediator factor Nemf [Geodia barretti]|uniref:Nuclear export mediator factor Nemf n=1 Tax=Geodia barretti TaxID=519541 RepID=A0AA35R2P7_GEOBA|nr:Nuclear export mediator factor Nemf [Geodia barretti]